ncbi:hypothetical protein GA0070616_4571 [Micromonospora nigra]|uniref:Uncharacterized protein n=1 Tax=Micromonospora nigra TaxID=145857 RepID=A0A1C6SU39_9ACTN|nr:hypothetical protein [Micromonospora nigra]SCL32852.1 hypothetical protein GA0070616_4571 [Micromonospora nigra]
MTIAADGAVPVRFEVTTPTGYRAILPACPCEIEDPRRKPCALRYGHGKSVKGADGCDGSNSVANGRCHDWHWPSAERFARDVLATFGTGTKTRTTQTVGVARGSLYIESSLLAWPSA